MDRFYITTTIPYVNGNPHIGHALEYIQADARARYERQNGKDVYFLAGTDENALKNVQAAEEAGKDINIYVDEKSAEFLKLKDSLDISFDDFIRTTEKRHFEGAKKFWQACNPDDIYKKEYKGLYCVGCAAFYTPEDLVDGHCLEHKKAPEVVEEENYFFKLSKYQKQIEELIESNSINIVPGFRKNEVLAFVRRGLEDISISRSKQRAHGWGVPVPGDEEQIMYVWFDALSNYITALDYVGKGELFDKYWIQVSQEKRKVVHVLGKGVSRFHAIYWIGMLLSAKLPLPTEEFVHGYMTIEDEKISKSLGNTVDPHILVKKYGTDAVRYFFLGGVSPFQDGDYSEERFEEYYTAHLANGVGNLTSRVLTMLEKYEQTSDFGPQATDDFGVEKFWKAYDTAFKEYKFDEVVKLTQEFVGKCDVLINQEKPWKKEKIGEDISALLYTLAEGLRQIAVALLPIIPDSAIKILNSLGTKETSKEWGKFEKNGIIKKEEILFPRL